MTSSTTPQTRNILLIDISTYQVDTPEIHRNIFAEKIKLQNVLWENRTGRKMITKGLNYSRGLLIIASYLLNDGFQVKYLVHADPIDREKIYEYSKEADVVCVSALTPTINIAADICANIKLINSKVTTIVGGSHATAVPVETLERYPNIDIVMIGDCETRLSKLLKNLESLHQINGIAFREKGGGHIIRINLPLTESEGEEVLLPAYSLLSRPLSNYAHNIKTCKGCPYQCNFCVERKSWHKSNQSGNNSVQTVIKELGFLLQYIEEGSMIHFSDTIFNLQWERTEEIVQRIARLEKKAVYSFDTRVDLISEEQIRFLNKADFLYCRMGFESVHNDILNTSYKSITTKEQVEASKIIRNAANTTAILAYIITGMPTTTRETLSLDIQSIYNLIESETVDVIGNGIFVPYPGTPFYSEPVKHGINLKSQQWELYDRRSFPVYELENLSSSEIYFGFLLQEAALCQAYKKRTINKKIETNLFEYTGLDYAYQNYISSKSGANLQ